MTTRARRVLVVVSYFRDGSHYPRSGRRDRQGDIYWANIAVNAATLRQVAGPEVEFVVFAGDGPPEQAGDLLAQAGAELRRLDFSHRPPDDFYIRYLGSLYLLDTMAALAPEVGRDDVILFVDPDLVWVSTLDPLLDEIRLGGIVGYDLHVPDTVPMCGLTRRQLGDVVAEIAGLGREAEAPTPTYFGGEHYGMLGSDLAGLVPNLERLWEASLQRYRDGRPHFNVEEHFMNAAMWERGEQVGRANRFLQRVRTLPHPMGSRERVHSELVAWHLPLEKDKGFLKVFRHLAAGRTMPPAGPDHQRWLSRQMGVAPIGARWAADRARQVKWAVTRRSSGDLGHKVTHGL